MMESEMFRDIEGNIRMEPDDGYSVRLEKRSTGAVDMLLELYVYGQSRMSEDGSGTVVRTYNGKDIYEGGERARDLQLAHAICRYFNIGGNWESLVSLIVDLRETKSANAGFDGLSMPEDYQLIDALEHFGPTYENHFLQVGTDRALIWTEGEFIEETTAADLLFKIEQPLEDDTQPGAV